MKNKLVILAILFGIGFALFGLLSIKLFSEASHNNGRALFIQRELNEQQRIMDGITPDKSLNAMRESTQSMDNGLTYLIANNNALRSDVLFLFALGLLNGGIAIFFILRSLKQKS
jgi:hypothetical protein